MPTHRSLHRLCALLAAVCVAAGCNTQAPTGSDPKPKRGNGPSVKGSPTADDAKSPGPLAPSPGVIAPLGSPDPTKAYFGRVLGLDGQPAAGVRVEARIIANHGGGLVTDNGAGVIANHGGGMISNGTGTMVSNGAGTYRLSQADATPPLTATTAADGTFTLAIPAGQKANIEAIQKDDVKAIRGGVAADAGGFDLRLAPTGTLQGKVATDPARGITNLQGVSVYIPGTSYIAITDAAGNFQIPRVPVGAYRLFAERPGIGSGVSQAVEVLSNAVGQAGEIKLAVPAVTITALDPPLVLPGSLVTVTGTNFGKSSGAAVQVRIGGVIVEGAVATSDTTITFKAPDYADGDLVIAVNGEQSAPRTFPLFYGFDAYAPAAPLAVGEAFQCRVTLEDYGGPAGVVVPVVWAVASGDAATVDATGKITAIKEGGATVTATYGGFAVTIDVTVSASGSGVGSLGGPTAKAAAGMRGVAVGEGGQLFVTTIGRVYKLGADGTMAILAGTKSGGGFADATGTAARFHGITALAADAAGKLLIGDAVRVRVADPATGAVTSLAGSTLGGSISMDGLGPAAGILNVSAIAPAPGGGAFFLEYKKLRRVGVDGAVTTIAGAPTLAALGTGPDGTVYGVGSKVVYRLDGAGAATAIVPQAAPGSWPAVATGGPRGLTVDAAGNVYVAFEGGIVKLAGDGTTSLLGAAPFGQVDGPLADARFKDVQDLAYDAAANAVIVVEAGAVRKIALAGAGTVSTIVHGEVGSTLVYGEPVADPGEDPEDPGDPEDLEDPGDLGEDEFSDTFPDEE